ncbi:ABC transporter permease [Jatrophihabitans cynanchi]|uniref:ABC transporter permease n=1 Tax=Jatrophihabitans cynanchi TaxID=2944128 RepID=A0ABY7JV29_9ACTN|nr:ABC transporter permease [Jatrophihabitans sp. SB3-54]WAX55157.1 ABC transporter permease [Jatrophihabitans sp. SB3-54]
MVHIARPVRQLGLAATLAALVCAAFAFVGAFAPLLVPDDPQHQDLTARLRAPLSAGHPLGTDVLGRDILSRLIAGTRESLLVAVIAVGISVVAGVAIGLVSGYFGGLLDSLLMRVVDAWLAFPFLLLAITIIAILGPGTRNVIIALVASEWVVYVRLVRGETLSIREREYVTSARMLGVSRTAIMVKHILPNIYGPILVVSTLELGIVIVTEASLSFLGLGANAATATWGAMLADGRAYLATAWWLATIPGLAIFVIVLAVNLLGDALRDFADPRMKAHRRGSELSATWPEPDPQLLEMAAH